MSAKTRAVLRLLDQMVPEDRKLRRWLDDGVDPMRGEKVDWEREIQEMQERIGRWFDGLWA